MLNEELEFINNLTLFLKKGKEMKMLKLGEFEVDPYTFYTIPGECTHGPEEGGLIWFRKVWKGNVFLCHWFDL